MSRKFRISDESRIPKNQDEVMNLPTELNDGGIAVEARPDKSGWGNNSERGIGQKGKESQKRFIFFNRHYAPAVHPKPSRPISLYVS